MNYLLSTMHNGLYYVFVRQSCLSTFQFRILVFVTLNVCNWILGAHAVCV